MNKQNVLQLMQNHRGRNDPDDDATDHAVTHGHDGSKPIKPNQIITTTDTTEG